MTATVAPTTPEQSRASASIHSTAGQDDGSAVLGRSAAAAPADGLQPLLRVRGPALDAEHLSRAGSRHAITPRREAQDHGGHGHAHGGGSCTGGHAKALGGGGHGHAHGGDDHGHSHGGHGHAHGGAVAVAVEEPALPTADGAVRLTRKTLRPPFAPATATPTTLTTLTPNLTRAPTTLNQQALAAMMGMSPPRSPGRSPRS